MAINKTKIQLTDFETKEDTQSIYKVVKDNPKDRIEVELGDSKDPTKFQPQVKIMRWDNEVNFSYRLKGSEKGTESISSGGNKLLLKKGNTESRLYELPVSKENPEGGFEFEIELKEKPVTNKIEFTLQTKGLVFYRQPLEILFGEPVSKEHILKEILSFSPKSVLDIGGNNGELVKELLEKGIEATCVDNSASGYENKVTENYLFEDIEKGLSVKDKSFDLVSIYGVTPYIKKDKVESVIREIIRVSNRAIISFNYFGYSPDMEGQENEYNAEWLREKFSLIDPDYDVTVLEAEIPQNVVVEDRVKGSYAVYCAEEKINYKNGKLYKAGKFGHIYRPQVEDAVGNKVWADLEIDSKNNLLAVTIPQEFLDNAIYPITHVAGLTFGYTSVGASSELRTMGDSIRATYDSFTGGDGTLKSMSIYCNSAIGFNETCKLKMAVYEGTALVATTNELQATKTSGWSGWNTANFSGTPSVSSTKSYYVCFNHNDFVDSIHMDMVKFYYDATTGGRYSNSSYDTWPNPITWATSTKSYKYKYSLYATYEEAGTEASSERGLYIKGYSESSSERGLYTQGYLTNSSERGLYIEGFISDLYSRESASDLESDDTALATTFSEQDYTDVESDDNVYVDLQGTARYMKFLFKEYNENESSEQKFDITWKGKSSLAPSSATVYLQVYNRTSGLWETLDSDSSSPANTKFTLEGSRATNLSDYYDEHYIISIRVYQKVE